MESRENNKIPSGIALIAVVGLIISIVALVSGYYNQRMQLELQARTVKIQENIEQLTIPCWKQMEKANADFDSGEYKNAVEWYDRALNNCDSESYRTLIMRYNGLVHLNLGINNETVRMVRDSPISSAERVIKHSLNYTPTNDSRDSFNVALNSFKELHDKNGDFQYLFYEGIAYLYLGEERKSIKYFNETIIDINKYPSEERDNDTISSAWYGMGVAYQKMGEEKGVEYAFNKANEIRIVEVQNSAALRNLALRLT